MGPDGGVAAVIVSKAERDVALSAQDLARLEPDEAIYLTADDVRKTAVPNTEAHAAELEAAGWRFHANDHDSVVFAGPNEDEVRVWDSGNWIRYTREQRFVSQGSGAAELRTELAGLRPLERGVQEQVDEAVAKVRAELSLQPKVARSVVREQELVRGRDHRVTKVITRETVEE